MILQILRYIPANLVPAFMAFAAVYAFTRHLTPAEFGHYTFAFTATLLCTQTLFYALPTVVQPMVPNAEREGRRRALLKTGYGMLAIIIVALNALTLAAWAIPPVRDAMPSAFWLAAPLAGLRGIVGINQSLNNLDARVLMFSIVECTQSALGVAIGIVLVVFVSPSAVSMMLGLIASAALCVLLDSRNSRLLFAAEPFLPDTAREVVRLAIPYTVTFTAASLLLYTDRFALETFSTSAQLGVYGVAASLVERPLTMVAIAVMSGLFPLALQKLRQVDTLGCRAQIARNMLALLGIVLPSAVGIALLARPIANVMVGPEFREEAALLIPFFTLVIFARTFATHCYDHAFFLSRQPHLQTRIYVPVCVLNVVLAAVGAWAAGSWGTLMAGLVCALLLVSLEAYFIQRSFPIPLDTRDILRTVVAATVMGAVVWSMPTPPGWLGLAQSIGLGVVAYAIMYIALDILGVRAEATRRLRRMLPVRAAK